MPFSARNAFYLRISNNTVLPTYIYLDERHVDWMSDTILQHVLSDMRPLLLSKLKAEADVVIGGNLAKKSTVDTHRGETYQFCYFLRKTESHSVVMKSRSFRTLQTDTMSAAITSKTRQYEKGKRKANCQGSLAQRTRSKRPRINPDEDQIDVEHDEVTTIGQQGNLNILVDEDSMDIDIEEDKPKPSLFLKYQGFNIYGHCLCVVVEPWPVVRTITTALSKTTTAKANQIHEPEPLFLPEEPEAEDSAQTSAITSQYVNKSYLEQVLSEVEIELSSDDEDEDVGGMMEFSQVLQNIGDSRAGAINDDDDMDNSVLFGDADEQRNL